MTTGAVLLLGASLLAQPDPSMLQYTDAATEIEQKLGARADLGATFRDHSGQVVTLADYCDGTRPVVLNFQYYRCPTLCGPVLNGLIEALDAIELQPGKDFTVLSISFDHRETPEIATDKRKAVLGVYSKPGAAEHWHFLTGEEAEIRKLTRSVGFGFRWNQTRNDFDHRAALIFLSPDGTITRYFQGVSYDPRSFHLAFVEASDGKVGSALDRFIVSCYGYDPRTGKYNKIGSTVMAAGGALTLAGLATLLFFLWRRESRKVAPASAT